MLYQIQTKYRDEARARAGLIRVREFTMKDAYSFHDSLECLQAYYERVHEAYERIFKRLGMKEVVSIQSDPGMMGGKIAHEFMALADCGEDTIFISPCGTYKANREVATSGLTFAKGEQLPLEKVHTPGKKSIEDVAAFLGVETSQTGKAVFYVNGDDELIFVVNVVVVRALPKAMTIIVKICNTLQFSCIEVKYMNFALMQILLRYGTKQFVR